MKVFHSIKSAITTPKSNDTDLFLIHYKVSVDQNIFFLVFHSDYGQSRRGGHKKMNFPVLASLCIVIYLLVGPHILFSLIISKLLHQNIFTSQIVTC